MPNIDQAIEYILGDVVPDGTFRVEALETYKELRAERYLERKSINKILTITK